MTCAPTASIYYSDREAQDKKKRRHLIFKWPFRQLVMPHLKIIRGESKNSLSCQNTQERNFCSSVVASRAPLDSDTVPDIR